jgi:bla regulator protein BlaR1
MIPNYLSSMWAAIAPTLGNHLWQSTLFAIVAGLLTLALRNNHAQSRYWLWLAASAKFLVPFSLLVGIGSYLPWPRGSVGTKDGLYIVMDQVSQPFARQKMSVISPIAPATDSPGLIHLLPAVLTAAWLCGFVLVICVWWVRWRRTCVAIRDAVPLREGREAEALCRLERLSGMPRRIEMRLSRTSLEPGIFGIFQPLLVWPEGISEHLEDTHLEAIIGHEVWHVRRRDNLAAAIHMVVESIFWFHPIVWWIGARLIEERERACDEEVLASGSDRQIYAESILKICEFCVGSPLACVSGVTGADLKKRIVRIMSGRGPRKLDFSRKLLLSTAGFASVAVPVVFGLLNATQSRAEGQAQITGALPPLYEVVSINPTSIKPNKSGGPLGSMWFATDEFTATDVTLRMVIKAAYKIEDDQIEGAPDWLNSEKFDINAKWDKSVVDALEELSQDQQMLERRRMLQALLADRFRLTLHREAYHFPTYELVIAQNGPKLQEAKPGNTHPNGITDMYGKGHSGLMSMRGGQLIAQGVPVPLLVKELLRELSRESGGCIIEDKTGLKGNYDFTLQWTPKESEAPMFRGTDGGQPRKPRTLSPESNWPSLFTAIQEQLGLKLEPQNGPGEILVIDHVEKPNAQVEPSNSQGADSGLSQSRSPITQTVGINSLTGWDSAGASKIQKPKDFTTPAVYWSLGIFYTPSPQWGHTTIVLNKVFFTTDSRYDASKLKDEFKSWVLARHSDWVDGYPRLSVVASAFTNRQSADSAQAASSKRSLDDELVEVEWTPSKP